MRQLLKRKKINKFKRLNCVSLEVPDTFSIFSTRGHATKIKAQNRKGKEKSYGRQNIIEFSNRPELL